MRPLCLIAPLLLCALPACPPPPANQPEPAAEVREVEEVTETCDSRSSESAELSPADPCLDGQDFALPVRCVRECGGCDGDRSCEVWCTGAGSDRRLDLSGCEPDQLFGG